MDFRLLGPFEVWRDGVPLALGGRRQRAVLALLAMHVGTVVSTDRIVEENVGADDTSSVRPANAPLLRVAACGRSSGTRVGTRSSAVSRVPPRP